VAVAVAAAGVVVKNLLGGAHEYAYEKAHTAAGHGEQWVCRRVASNGIVSVGYQQVSVGKHYGGSACDVLVTDGVLQFWVGNQLLKTVVRTITGEVRKLHADGTAPRR